MLFKADTMQALKVVRFNQVARKVYDIIETYLINHTANSAKINFRRIYYANPTDPRFYIIPNFILIAIYT